MPVINIESEKQFYDILKDKTNKHVIVDFYAQWCGPCKKFSPTYDKHSNTYKTITFVKVDVDEVPELAETFEIRAMPTFLVFETGKKVPAYSPLVGADPVKIENMLKMLSGSSKSSDDDF